MLRIFLSLAILAAAATAQETPKADGEKQEKEAAQKVVIAVPFDSGPCAIPLLEAQPRAEASIRQMRPREDVVDSKFVHDPMPSCGEARAVQPEIRIQRRMPPRFWKQP